MPCIVSEPFANKHHVQAGDTITLPLGGKLAQFRIIDIFYDYGNERGYIVLDRATMLRYLPDPAPSNLAVYIASGSGSRNGAQARSSRPQPVSDVLIFSNREIRREGDAHLRPDICHHLCAGSCRGDRGGDGHCGRADVDRDRPAARVRIAALSWGATSAQIRKLILVEAGLIGFWPILRAWRSGVVLSLVLIFVINKQSFGWTIQFHWPVAVLLGALSVVYVATVLAGLYPARVAQRLNPIEVVHEE